MKIELKDYQEAAVGQLATQIRNARASVPETRHAFVLSAPTGSGKTAIVSTVMERLIEGDEAAGPIADATFLWVTDAPELNEQTKKKLLSTSEVFTPERVETIDTAFDQATFSAGRIYFLNTQKLGQATSYTRSGDARTHTLWETISRTVAERPTSFFMIIDEAHKGLGRRAAEIAETGTIVQRLIVGSNGFRPPPILLGISATPARFNTLLEATDRVRWPTNVSPDAVRVSGLIKDDVVLWHTKKNGRSDWALLHQAAAKLREYEKDWADFAHREDRDLVRPILVVQVTDGSGRKASKTDLATALTEIESVLGPLPEEAVVHCFQEQSSVEFAEGRSVPKVQPSDIQDDDRIRVVFFKMALNTGWDCPRAEVMMSFRRAIDATLIAQLVGRMVRTPLAERILSNQFLNSVSLYLPNWDDEALGRVIDHLTSSDDAVATTVERGENLVTYNRAPRSKPLFEAAALLPTYPSRRVSRSSNVKRLMQLSRYLANDEIAPTALDDARDLVIKTLDDNRKRLKSKMQRMVAAIQGADLIEIRVAISGTSVAEPNSGNPTSRSIALVEQDIRELFADAGRRLGGGLHVSYVTTRTEAKRGPSPTIARAELAALMNDRDTLEDLERRCGETIRRLWTQHHAARLALTVDRQAEYGKVNRMAAAPEAEDLLLPTKVSAPKGTRSWKKHLLVDAHGDFYPSPTLNRWEELTLEAEMSRPGFRAWYRNPVRGEWSLGVPYEDTGMSAVMYPDFVTFRSVGTGGILCDLLEPHAHNQADLAPKLLGLCKFAERHGDRFGRIEMIVAEGSKGKERLLRVDVNDPDIRQKARLLTENAQVVEYARELSR